MFECQVSNTRVRITEDRLVALKKVSDIAWKGCVEKTLCVELGRLTYSMLQ